MPDVKTAGSHRAAGWPSARWARRPPATTVHQKGPAILSAVALLRAQTLAAVSDHTRLSLTLTRRREGPVFTRPGSQTRGRGPVVYKPVVSTARPGDCPGARAPSRAATTRPRIRSRQTPASDMPTSGPTPSLGRRSSPAGPAPCLGPVAPGAPQRVGERADQRLREDALEQRREDVAHERNHAPPDPAIDRCRFHARSEIDSTLPHIVISANCLWFRFPIQFPAHAHTWSPWIA